MVCTSSEVMPKKDGGSNPSGCWYEELAAPYLVFKEKGYDVTVVSVKGGKVPFDAASLSGDFFTAACSKFKEAHEAAVCGSTKSLADVDVQSFDAVYFPGGHACYGDMVRFVCFNLL